MSKFLASFAAAFIALPVAALPAAAHAAACNEANSIVRVRNTSIGAFEYVVFKYKKPPNLPSFTVKAVTPPFIQDGSGETVIVRGSKFTEVRFDGVVWTCSIIERLVLPKAAIKAVKNIGQFEGIITYIIGRRSSSRYISNYSYNSGPGFRSIVIKYRK